MSTPGVIDLLSCLTQGAAPVSRTLFWRYKANAQRAVRDGDFKALKIGTNGYLFNVAADPLERADLKKRHADIYRKLTEEWNAWNRAMLPELETTFTESFNATEWADHINTPAIDMKAIDDGGDWPGLLPP